MAQLFYDANWWETPEVDGMTRDAVPVVEAVLLSRLQEIAKLHDNPTFLSNLWIEGLVITDLIAKCRLPIAVVTMVTNQDDALLSNILSRTERYFDLSIAGYHSSSSNAIISDSDYSHVDAWITGQRREEAEVDDSLPFEENETTNGIISYHPIADWNQSLIWGYILMHGLPYKTLYNKDCASGIDDLLLRPGQGCGNFRVGRWWRERKAN